MTCELCQDTSFHPKSSTKIITIWGLEGMQAVSRNCMQIEKRSIEKEVRIITSVRDKVTYGCYDFQCVACFPDPFANVYILLISSFGRTAFICAIITSITSMTFANIYILFVKFRENVICLYFAVKVLKKWMCTGATCRR